MKTKTFTASLKAFLLFLSLSVLSLNLFAQIPATYCDGNPADWANFRTTYPINGYSLDVANDGSNADNQFTNGSKDGDQISAWRWVLGNANAKGDITNSGVALTGPNNCILRFFGDRTSDNGDASIGFWFYVNPVSTNANGTFSGVHTNGDLLILSDFTNGGAVPVISVYTWQNGNLVLKNTTVSTVCAAVNQTTSPVPAGLTYTNSSGGNQYAPNTFYEGALNLCALGIPSCFSTFLFETRNSQSITASLQDFAVGSFNATPARPTAVVTQPTCTVATGTVAVSSPNSGYTYTLTGTNPVRAAVSNNTGVFTNVLPGTYSLTAAQGNCVSAPATIVVNAQPPTPAAPTLSVVQPTCTSAANSLTVTAPLGSGLTYSLDGGAFGTATTFSNLSAGSHCVRVMNSFGCISPQTCATINAQPPTPAAPALSVVQPTCTSAANSLTVTAPLGSGLTYSLDGGAFGTATTFSNLSAGSHCVRVANSFGCVSPQTCATINAQPPTPAAPALSVVQPTCTSAANSITVTSPLGSGLTYSLDGGAFGTATTFSNLSAGSHCVVVMNSFGCVSPQTCASINAQPATPARPVITITEATLCGTVTSPYITVLCPVSGVTYTLTQTGVAARSITYNGTGSVVFNNLIAGKGFSITATSPLGCVSAATDCSNYTTNSCPAAKTAPVAKTVVIKPVTKVVAYPNPYNDKVNFVINPVVSGKASLEVFNLSGQKIGTLYQGHVEAGVGQTIEYSVPQASRTNLVYVLKMGKERITGKLLQGE